MKYLCLIYHDEAKVASMPESEYIALRNEVLELRDELRASGHFIASNPLQPVRSATTVRVRGGSTFLTDGPFAETKEQLGGYFLIESRDLNDAIRIASKIPLARLGCIEVRPIREIEECDPICMEGTG